MDLIYLFFIAVINSIDNIGIGVAYSIAGIRVSLLKNILISFLAFLVSFIASYSGGVISHYVSEDTSSILSMILLVSMGLWMIYRAYLEKEGSNIEHVRVLKYKEAIYIGIILALDDIGSSVSSGLIGYEAFWVSIPYFIVSFFIFSLANYGTKFSSKFVTGKKATIAAGLLMILIGILGVFE